MLTMALSVKPSEAEQEHVITVSSGLYCQRPGNATIPNDDKHIC